MCNFVSWKEYKGKVYFLQNVDLDTKDGKKLLKDEYRNDIEGHGAIEHYYPELSGKGENKECEDFSTPDNFPKEIVEAIKQGKLSRIGICLDVLNKQGKDKYKRITQPARDEYERIRQSAWAEYEKIRQASYARAEYEKIRQSAFSKVVSQRKYRNQNWK